MTSNQPSAPYDGRISDVAKQFADVQYRQPLVQAELNSVMFEHFDKRGVDVEKLYEGSAEERKAEWAKVDTKSLGTSAADLALDRTVLSKLGSYSGDFKEDTEKFRNGELEDEKLEEYRSMAALMRSAGYDVEGFIESVENIKDSRNLASAVSRNLQPMIGWRANSDAQEFLSREVPRNYEEWKGGEDKGPADLTQRLNRLIDRRTREVLDDMLE